MGSSYVKPQGTTEIGTYGTNNAVYYNKDTDTFYLYDVNAAASGSGLGLGSKFEEVTDKSTIRKLQIQFASQRSSSTVDTGLGQISSGPLSNPSSTTEFDTYIRYPNGVTLDIDTDYVLFQFGKYVPPFSQQSANNNTINQYESYNASTNEMTDQTVKVKAWSGENYDIGSVVLPMPQDLSNEQKQNWQGKSFTRLGKSVIAAAAGGDMSKIGSTFKDVSGNAKAIQTALTAGVLNAIPGVGGNITFNDIAGSTRGIVLNPNAEVLYDSPDLREIGMVFKMYAQSDQEAKHIKLICDTFRTASLPKFGAEGDVSFTSGQKQLTGDNFIRVPLLCKFSFMRGGDTNKWIPQYKPCAITQVEVNYTPDGTYATYEDGSPVATELSIKFIETKLIFDNEIEKGF